MALDAGIYSQIQQPQQQNPLALLAQAYQLKNLQRQGDQADMEMQQKNKLLSLVGGQDFQKMDTTGRANALQGVGAFEQAGNLVRTDAAVGKDKREAEKFQLEGALKKMEAMGQIMGSVKDQASYDIARQQAAQIFGPEAAASISPVYNPAEVAQKQRQALAVKDRMTLELQRRSQDITMRGQDMTQSTALQNNASTVGATLRGQDLTDARARENITNGRVPSGYRQTADGSLEFIPGGPADPASKAGGGKPLTEGQSKALLFGTRMKESNDVLDKLATGTDAVDRPGLLKRAADAVPNYMGGGLLQAGANYTQSSGQQQVEQAQRDFLNAVLRRESGAVIADSEFDNARKQYFPQPNDTPANIAQKKRNREVAMRGVLEEVPDSETRVAKIRGQSQEASTPPSGLQKKTLKPGGAARPADKAAFDALPSGTLFVAPDGTTRRKP